MNFLGSKAVPCEVTSSRKVIQTLLVLASEPPVVGALGDAQFQREDEACGWDFPSMKERSDRFQEACELIRKLFTADGPVDYDGRYYRLDQAPLSPGCYQQPHIPIMVAGTGERRTLRTLAMHGDIMNLDGCAGGGMAFSSTISTRLACSSGTARSSVVIRRRSNTR